MSEMRYIVLSVCTLGAGLMSAPSQAQSIEERLKACSMKQTQGEKLACYDSLSAPTKAAPAPAPAPVPAASPAPAPAAPKPVPEAAPVRAAEPSSTPEAEFGMQGELRRKRAEEAGSASAEPAKMVAHVSKVIRRPGDTFGFELDNGQLWVQTQKQFGPPATPGQQVTITSGALGSFFLTYESGIRSRVMRVR